MQYNPTDPELNRLFRICIARLSEFPKSQDFSAQVQLSAPSNIVIGQELKVHFKYNPMVSSFTQAEESKSTANLLERLRGDHFLLSSVHNTNDDHSSLDWIGLFKQTQNQKSNHTKVNKKEKLIAWVMVPQVFGDFE